MTDNPTQSSQASGDGSTAYQAGNDINVYREGVSPAQAIDIFHSLFEANSLRLVEEASELATARAEELTRGFIHRLGGSYDLLNSLRDPDVQYGIFVAQRDYARSGSASLRDTLIGLLVDRCSPRNTDLQKIVLSEAITTVRVLTPDQIATLTVIWLVLRVRTTAAHSPADLVTWLDHNVSPFADDLLKNPTGFEHLQYAGCGQLETGTCHIGRAMLEKHPELFHRHHASSEDEAATLLTTLSPRWKSLVDTWQSGSMKNFSLTTVGTAIAHSNWARTTGSQAPLSIWLS